MKLIKGSKNLIYIFKAFYAYQAYAVFKNLKYLEQINNPTISCLIYSCLVLSLLAVFFTRQQILRILIAIASYFFVVKLFYLCESRHARHILSYISFFLIFISNKKQNSRSQELEDLLAFWLIQIVLLTTYTFSGMHKLILSFNQSSEILGYFSSNSLALVVAAWKFSIGSTSSSFVDLLINHPKISQALGASLVIIEFVSIASIINSKLSKLWGLLLIGIHLGIWLIMNILFQANIVCCFLFLVMNPLQYNCFPYKSFFSFFKTK